MQRVFITKYFLRTVGSFCRVKRFTTGSRNSIKTFENADDGRPGRHVEIATEVIVQQVEKLIRTYRRIAIASVAMR
jgi:hypothetical protein